MLQNFQSLRRQVSPIAVIPPSLIPSLLLTTVLVGTIPSTAEAHSSTPISASPTTELLNLPGLNLLGHASEVKGDRIDKRIDRIASRANRRPRGPRRVNPNRPTSGQALSTFAQTMLDRHNAYRSEVGVSPLQWSGRLAANAQGWANQLAARGGQTLEHSQGSGEGENLWMGTAGAYSHQSMVDSWGSEKQYYQAGLFPEISTTGNWMDVGHYTQIVWRNTQEVGCALATAGGNDILVCRYSTPGNYMGERAF